MSPKHKSYTLKDMEALISEGLRDSIKKETIHNYTPHDKQLTFHSATTTGRLYIGGNRAGKTVGGVAEDIFRLRGTHPYQQVPPAPVEGRFITVSFTEGIKDIAIPNLQTWLPPSDLIGGSWEESYRPSERKLTLANKSTLELMSYDQDVAKFAGVPRDFTHFDEEPPKAIFDECKMRLVDRDGKWYITMTPVDGITWVYDSLYLPGLAGGNNITVIVVDSAENPHISQKALAEVVAGLDESDRQARKEGKFVQIGGLVFKSFRPVDHIIDPLNLRKLTAIKDWTHYCSLDHGLNNPTAWLWHAVSPQGNIVTYDELYANETLIPTFASEIHRRNQLECRRAPDIYVGDPAIAQRNAQTGDSVKVAYTIHGIPVMLGNNNVPIGVEKMNRYFENGKWLITANCTNLIRELQRVRWKTFDSAKKRHDNNVREEIHKHNDHAPDSARYMFSMMPDLYLPEVKGEDKIERVNQNIRSFLSAITTPIGPGYIDTNLQKDPKSNYTEWEYADDHMGGFW